MISANGANHPSPGQSTSQARRRPGSDPRARKQGLKARTIRCSRRTQVQPALCSRCVLRCRVTDQHTRALLDFKRVPCGVRRVYRSCFMPLHSCGFTRSPCYLPHDLPAVSQKRSPSPRRQSCKVLTELRPRMRICSARKECML